MKREDSTWVQHNVWRRSLYNWTIGRMLCILYKHFWDYEGPGRNQDVKGHIECMFFFQRTCTSCGSYHVQCMYHNQDSL